MAWKLFSCYANSRGMKGETLEEFCQRFVYNKICKQDKKGEDVYSDEDWKAFLEKLTAINHHTERYLMENCLKKYSVSV